MAIGLYNFYALISKYIISYSDEEADTIAHWLETPET